MVTGRLRAGDLRHRVTLRRAALAQDDQGGFDQVWTTLAVIGARIEGLDGREALIAQAFQGVGHYRLTIRWRADIRTSDQLVLPDGTELVVRSVSDIDGRRRSLQLLADTAPVQEEAA